MCMVQTIVEKGDLYGLSFSLSHKFVRKLGVLEGIPTSQDELTRDSLLEEQPKVCNCLTILSIKLTAGSSPL